MLQRITQTLIVFIFSSSWSIAQRNYSDSLVALERLVYESPDSSKSLAIYNKLTFMIHSDSLGTSAFKEVKRIAYKELPEKDVNSFLWNATVISYLNNEFTRGLIYWKRLQIEDNNPPSVAVKTMGFLLSENRDSVLHLRLLNELSATDSLFTTYERCASTSIKPKAVGFKKVASWIIPGSGLIMNGNIGKGALALGINTSLVIFIRYLIQQNAYVNAALWGTNLIGKFYFGDLRLLHLEIARKTQRKKNERTEKSALILETILNRYPIELR